MGGESGFARDGVGDMYYTARPWRSGLSERLTIVIEKVIRHG
jgi:hypothetical protein